MPRTVVTSLSIQLRLDLMQTGRFITVYSGAMMAHPTRTFPFKSLPVDFGDAAGPMAAITLKGRRAPGALKLLQNEMRLIAKRIAAAEQAKWKGCRILAHLYGPAARCKPKVMIWR